MLFVESVIRKRRKTMGGKKKHLVTSEARSTTVHSFTNSLSRRYLDCQALLLDSINVETLRIHWMWCRPFGLSNLPRATQGSGSRSSVVLMLFLFVRWARKMPTFHLNESSRAQDATVNRLWIRTIFLFLSFFQVIFTNVFAVRARVWVNVWASACRWKLTVFSVECSMFKKKKKTRRKSWSPLYSSTAVCCQILSNADTSLPSRVRKNRKHRLLNSGLLFVFSFFLPF